MGGRQSFMTLRWETTKSPERAATIKPARGMTLLRAGDRLTRLRWWPIGANGNCSDLAARGTRESREISDMECPSNKAVLYLSVRSSSSHYIDWYYAFFLQPLGERAARTLPSTKRQ